MIHLVPKLSCSLRCPVENGNTKWYDIYSPVTLAEWRELLCCASGKNENPTPMLYQYALKKPADYINMVTSFKVLLMNDFQVSGPCYFSISLDFFLPFLFILISKIWLFNLHRVLGIVNRNREQRGESVYSKLITMVGRKLISTDWSPA